MKASSILICGVSLAAGCQSGWEGVLASLSDPDPRQRAEAVRRIARGGSPDDLSSLIYRVNDPAPDVRAAIAQALGSLDNRQASDALAALVTDDSESVQLQAAAALARQRNPRAHHYLLLAYQRGGPRLRARVAELLKAGGGSPAEAVAAEAEALYAKYSEDLAGSGPERLIAAERLGSSGRPEAIERLTSYLGAEPRSLAVAAARGLGASDSPEARAPLEALLNEEDPGLQLAGAEALGELGDPRAAIALSRAIQQNDQLARTALRSLVRLGQLEGDGTGTSRTHISDLLCELLPGFDTALANQAAIAIEELGGSCAPEKLRARLSHGGNVEGVLTAITVLWGTERGSQVNASNEIIDQGHVSTVLSSLLRSGTPQVRALAARAVGALGLASLEGDLERTRKEAALEVVRSREHWIKSPLALVPVDAVGRNLPAVSVQGSRGSPVNDAPSLFSPEPSAALAIWAEATAAEIRLRLPQASASATLLANDPAPAVRSIAAGSITWIAGDQQWQILKPLLNDVDPEVRRAAMSQLTRLDPKVVAAGDWMLAELTEATPEADAVPLVGALIRFRGLAGLDQALRTALERPDTAPAAAAALAAVDDTDARAIILSHLREPFALALPELLRAVAPRADPPWSGAETRAASGACRALVFHSRPEVRVAAVRALKAIDGPEATAWVQPLTMDYDVRVRRAVGQHP